MISEAELLEGIEIETQGEENEQSIEETEIETSEDSGEDGEGDSEGSEAEESLEGELEGSEDGDSEEEDGEQEEVKETPQITPDTRLTVKVNGQEMELSVEDLTKGYELGAGAHMKFQEAARIREQSKNLLNQIKKDPFGTLAKLNVDVDAEVKNRIASMLEYEAMDEAEKKAHDYKLQLDALMREKEEMAELEKRQRQHEETQKQKEIIQGQITEAIEKTPGLPKNEYTVAKFAKYMISFREEGYEPPMAEIAKKVKSDYKTYLETFIGSMSDEQRAEFLGEDVVRGVSKTYAKKKLKNNYNAPTGKKKTQNGNKNEKMAMSDFREMMAKEFGGYA